MLSTVPHARATRAILTVAAVLGLAAMTAGGQTLPLPRYVIQELPTLGGTESDGRDVNDRGIIAGTATRFNQGYHVACAWDFGPGGDRLGHYLSGSGGSVARCIAINASGTLGGSSDIIDFGGFLGTINGVQATNLFNNRWGEVVRMNDAGDMVGEWADGAGSHPFVMRGGVFTNLPLLGGTQGGATGISNTGHIVGVTDGPSGGLSSGLPRPVRWVNGNVSELPGLGGWGQANAVNDAGVVAGYTSPVGSNPYIACIWMADDQRIPLGTLVPGHWFNWALDINNASQVVGVSADLAFLWEPAASGESHMQDLNNLISPHAGWILRTANGISESGLIVGQGLHNGVMRGFLLTPRCAGDFTADGVVTVGDVFAFLGEYFAGAASADVNHSGSITVQDVFDFLATYFAGCA